MSTRKDVPTYMMRLFPSRIEKYVIFSLYIGLTAIIVVLPMRWCIPLITALSLHVFFLLSKASKYIHLTTQGEGFLLLEDRTGNTRYVQIRQESVVFPFLIILSVQHDYKEFILLWPDSADTTALRHLRIWLYWHWPTTLKSSLKQH
jgi:hypothetical protein